MARKMALIDKTDMVRSSADGELACCQLNPLGEPVRYAVALVGDAWEKTRTPEFPLNAKDAPFRRAFSASLRRCL